MIVCICNAVSSDEIKREAAAGCPSFSHLQERVGVAVACGTCHDCAMKVFHEARQPSVVVNFGNRKEDRAPSWAVPATSLAK